MPVYIRIMLLLSILFILVFAFQATDAGGSQRDLITLSDNNTVILNVPIDGDSVRTVQKELLEKSDKLSRGADIYLVLNTPGGSVTDGMDLIQLAKGLPQQVHTISIFSASMGFITSQYLGKRYVLENSTMMSHRASAEGMDGQVEGSLNVRVDYLTSQINAIEKDVANRAGYSIEAYQGMIRNELWMSGEAAVKAKFADKIVRIRCDKTLRGPGSSRIVRFLIFTAEITYDKCPLITTPSVVMGDKYLVDLLQTDKRSQVRMFNKR